MHFSRISCEHESESKRDASLSDADARTAADVVPWPPCIVFTRRMMSSSICCGDRSLFGIDRMFIWAAASRRLDSDAIFGFFALSLIASVFSGGFEITFE